jgi:hypothetical protein
MTRPSRPKERSSRPAGDSRASAKCLDGHGAGTRVAGRELGHRRAADPEPRIQLTWDRRRCRDRDRGHQYRCQYHRPRQTARPQPSSHISPRQKSTRCPVAKSLLCEKPEQAKLGLYQFRLGQVLERDYAS